MKLLFKILERFFGRKVICDGGGLRIRLDTYAIVILGCSRRRGFPQNYRWQNGKQYKGKPKRGQSALARRVRQGCTSPPPPLHHSNMGWLRNSIIQILQTWNCDKIILNFAKLEENFTKHKIKNFGKISRNYENEIFLQPPYSYTICCLLLTLPSRLLKDSSLRHGNAT